MENFTMMLGYNPEVTNIHTSLSKEQSVTLFIPGSQKR
jgi:hypothetical protein